jgi:hypothetical protein
MLKAVLLIAITWTTLSVLFCLAWARALVALSDTRCVARGGFRAERPRASGLAPLFGGLPMRASVVQDGTHRRYQGSHCAR